jgi:hypothetical protein
MKASLTALALSLTACATAAAGAWTLPNPSTTPGAIGSSDPVVVCAYGYASAHRDVPYAVRDRVYNEYGIPRGHRAGLRIDHLLYVLRVSTTSSTEREKSRR